MTQPQGNESPIQPTAPSPPPPAAQSPTPEDKRERLWAAVQFVLALAVTSAVLAYLLFWPAIPHDDFRTGIQVDPTEIVRVVGPSLIRIEPDSALYQKLRDRWVDVQTTTLTTPQLIVTGTVLASLRPGREGRPDFWQFETPELASTFAEWQQAQAEVEFQQQQLEQARELAKIREEAQKKLIARLEKLVAIGTESPRELAAERANLLQQQAEDRRDIHETQGAVRTAEREVVALALQIQLTGLDPELLGTLTPDDDIIVADVPEAQQRFVRVGAGIEARFFAHPEKVFPGKVESVSAVVLRERRTLRALFIIHDPDDELRPGMFAEVGLGTDPRPALLVPADSVLHINRNDYVLVAHEDHTWRVVEVRVGEAIDGRLEILSGLSPGDRVLGHGAILLKPSVLRALFSDASEKRSDASPRRR